MPEFFFARRVRVLAAFVSVLTIAVTGCGGRRDVPPVPAASSPGALQRLVDEQAAATHVPAKLIMAVIQVESGGNERAVNPAGTSFGLMQLTRATAHAYGADDPLDPYANVSAGAKLLRDLLARYHGNIPLALAAYNLGPRAVDNAHAVPPAARSYVQHVMAVYDGPTNSESAPRF